MFGQEEFTFVPMRMRPLPPMDCLKAPQASLMKVGVVLEKQHQPFPSIIVSQGALRSASQRYHRRGGYPGVNTAAFFTVGVALLHPNISIFERQDYVFATATPNSQT